MQKPRNEGSESDVKPTSGAAQFLGATWGLWVAAPKKHQMFVFAVICPVRFVLFWGHRQVIHRNFVVAEPLKGGQDLLRLRVSGQATVLLPAAPGVSLARDGHRLCDR